MTGYVTRLLPGHHVAVKELEVVEAENMSRAQ
eukprot:COSAG01_NODE_70881_length_257_cov_0.987342_1_plen_31_part_10